MNDERVRRALGAIGDAAGEPSRWDDVIDTTPSAQRGVARRFPARRALALVAGVAVVVAVGAVLSDGPDRRIVPSESATVPVTGPTSTAPDGPVVSATGWRQVDDLPLGRTSPLVASISGQIHVIGGRTTVCPATAYCAEPLPDLLDGFALEGDAWVPIADAARAIDAQSPWAVVDGVLFVLADAADDTPNADSSPTLLAYDPGVDEWSTVEVPMAAARDNVRLVEVDGGVLVVPVWDGLGMPILRLDGSTREWTTLPDPGGVSLTDRRVVAVGTRLYLFGFPAADELASRPNVRVYEDGDWRPSSDAEVATTGPWIVAGTDIVNPTGGCTQIDGACVPNGGVYDTDSDEWSLLPADPSSSTAVGSSMAMTADRSILANQGASQVDVLDLTTGDWITVPPAPAPPDDTAERPSAAVGRSVVVAGGYRCTTPISSCTSVAGLLSGVWIWTPPAAVFGPETSATPAGWSRLPDSPLSPRYDSIVQRVGDDVYVIGGDTDLCPPAADCALDPTYESLRDGAVLDLTTAGDWRPIATAPVPLSVRGGSALTMGGDIIIATANYTGAEPKQDLWRYSPAEDSWSELPSDPDGGNGALVAWGDEIAVIAGSDERTVRPDRALDLRTGTWRNLPEDPLGPSFDRFMVPAGDSVYLLAKDLVPNPGAGAVPSVARTARFDLTTQTWEVLPDSEILTTGPWMVAGDLLVNPSLGCADGGGNSYGRCYPMGGIFDTRTDTWTALPVIEGLGDKPYGEDAAAVTAGAALSTVNYLLDQGFRVLDTDELELGAAAWSQESWPEGTPPRPVVAVGSDLLLPPAVTWTDSGSKFLDDLWIWRSP